MLEQHSDNAAGGRKQRIAEQLTAEHSGTCSMNRSDRTRVVGNPSGTATRSRDRVGTHSQQDICSASGLAG